MIRIRTMVDDDVYQQIQALAAQHTKGNVSAMVSIMLRQAALGQDWDYALEKEERLRKAIERGNNEKGE